MSPADLPHPDPDPDAIVTAVRSCPTVAGLSGGIAGAAATYLPGRRVDGVRIDDTTVTVHVVGRYGPTMTEVGAEVAAAVTPLAGGRSVRVVIEDLALPADLDPSGPVGPDPSPAPVGERPRSRVI